MWYYGMCKYICINRIKSIQKVSKLYTLCIVRPNPIDNCYIYSTRVLQQPHYKYFALCYVMLRFKIFLHYRFVLYTTGKKYRIFSNCQLTAKWTTKFENYDFGLFSVLDFVSNSCCLIVRCLPYPILCCIEILYTIPLFIYCLIWCD